MSGGIKWEDPVHSQWFNNGPLEPLVVLQTNLFLGRVYDNARNILKDAERVIKEFLVYPNSNPLSLNACSQSSLDPDKENRKKKRRDSLCVSISKSINPQEFSIEDPFLFNLPLTSLNQVFAVAEKEVCNYRYILNSCVYVRFFFFLMLLFGLLFFARW